MVKKQTLTSFLRKMLDMRWSEFYTMEHKPGEYTSNEAVIFALIRACVNGKLPAIKESLDRLDGKVAMQIEVEYPKFYYRYPYAKAVEGGESAPHVDAEAPNEPTETLPERQEQEELSAGSLRATLERMADEPRSLVKVIIEAAAQVEVDLNANRPANKYNDPLVKSVMAAGLLNMAHKGNLGAIFEVLEQIEGKVADKIKVLGDDVYVNVYSEIAPHGAVKNADGIYQIEAQNTTNAWAAALERSRKIDERRK